MNFNSSEKGNPHLLNVHDFHFKVANHLYSTNTYTYIAGRLYLYTSDEFFLVWLRWKRALGKSVLLLYTTLLFHCGSTSI